MTQIARPQSDQTIDDPAASSQDPSALRRHKRHETTLPSILNCRGSLQTVVIRDISKSGAKVSQTYGLFPGDPVTLRLPDRTKVSGKVVWSLGSDCGIQFDVPLLEVSERWEF